MEKSFANWIKERGIAEVECLVPDLNSVVRGKVFPAQKFLQSERDGSLRIPSSIYLLTVTGEYADDADEALSMQDPDVVLRPDLETLCVAPGYKTPTAFVFADAYHTSGEPYDIAPRYVLKRVVELYEKLGLRPMVAPELEFYLTQVNTDPDLPLMPPAGRSGRSETSPQPYGLEAITEYEDLIETIYEHAEAASLHLDTMIHESGTAQLEINFNHGDPVHVSDQVLVFKRIVRQVALKHGVYATFMAKPMENQPGSAMHLHVSVVDAKKGNNLFGVEKAEGVDGNTDMFRHFVGGLQKYLGDVTPLFAPNVNSFRRMRPDFSAPINLQWGYDNRSCGLRVPISRPENRRIENRLPGADANPYLAIAAVLVCGYIGIRDKIAPNEMVQGSAYKWARTLPRTLSEGLDRFKTCQPVIELLGEHFCTAFQMIKAHELSNFEGVISSWERDHLLLKV
ncbi:glutamine synthetase family protein [Vitreimonas flagellata]|uniref:glutamine synthetase family protein n=1 Tax=Vitreimonas flagellata TaxID=2560861 RepID=UPI0010753737|nr:glutamine synthetase family protein [Vitreimonas flagellata]